MLVYKCEFIRINTTTPWETFGGVMNKRIFRLAFFTATMLAILVFLNSCYLEPDRTQEIDNTIGNTAQGFEPVVTPTPTATPEPTATPIPTEVPIQVTPEPTPVPNLANPTINLDVFTKPSEGGTSNIGGTGSTDTTGGTQVPTTVPQTTVTGSETTTSPTSAATATPSPTSSSLKVGSEGDRVVQLQKRLAQLGYYSGKADGKFGAGTESALKAFQKANKLKADGVAGNQTINVLYGSNPVKANTGSSSGSSSGSGSRTTATPRPTAKPNIPKNKFISTTSSSTGSDVRNLQNRLIELGYLAGTADGVFGSATEKAVIAFQKRNMPYADGIAGPETLAKLYSSSAKRANKTAAVVAKAGQSLREGDKGEDVRAMQKRLIELGYLSGSADGSFGPSTKQAIINFQNDNGVTADGIAGTETLNLLFTDYPDGVGIIVDSPVVAEAGTVVEDTTVSSTGYRTIHINATGSSVSNLQTKLKELGFYNGEVNATLDEETREAVMAFQQANFLTVDGIAGPATQRLLYATIEANVNYPTVNEKSSSEDILNLQYTLYELGYYQDLINGVYNDSLELAIKEFQENNGLQVDGVAASDTLSLLYSSFARPALATRAEYVTLDLDSEGDPVAQLQDALIALGYLQNFTNIYDKDTQRAVLTFQTYNGLTATGIADIDTQIRLYSEAAIPAP